ncbi:MAG: branched-chain amino acid ABC transporter substrate-binding protein [Alphaproteobacteria bacterium]|nr:branched-chain amino acid ABC transporter substrate-binding protein [Alphaproteobacteria bacterium]
MKRFPYYLSLALTVSGGAAWADVTIATVGPVTGSEAAIGEQMRHGAEAAVGDLNARGGVLGQKIIMEMGDDACDAKQAVALANKLAQEKVALVAGHFCSSASIPASAVYHEENILQITPGSTNPKLTEQGFENVFRVCGRDDQQGLVDGNYIVSHFKGKNVAIVHDKQTYSRGLADVVQQTLHAGGVKEALYETITPGEKDYSVLVTKLKAANIDLLFFGGYKTEAGLIARQMREQNLKTVLMGGDALVTNEYWSITGPAGEGTLMSFSPDPRKDPRNAALVARFKAGGYDPEAYTLYAYATVQAWAQAAAKAQSFDTRKVETALKANRFDTVVGDIGFDGKGDVTAPGYVVYVWHDGTYDYAK